MIATKPPSTLPMSMPSSRFTPPTASLCRRTLPPLKARLQCVRAYEHVFGTIELDIAFSIDEIAVDHNVAFATTGSKGRVTILSEKVTVPEENRELFVFQKIDGVWKIARYMFNKTS